MRKAPGVERQARSGPRLLYDRGSQGRELVWSGCKPEKKAPGWWVWSRPGPGSGRSPVAEGGRLLQAPGCLPEPGNNLEQGGSEQGL